MQIETIFPDNDNRLHYIIDALGDAGAANDVETASMFFRTCLENMDSCMIFRATPLAVLVMTHSHPNFSQMESRKRLYLELSERWEKALGKEMAKKLLAGLNK